MTFCCLGVGRLSFLDRFDKCDGRKINFLDRFKGFVCAIINMEIKLCFLAILIPSLHYWSRWSQWPILVTRHAFRLPCCRNVSRVCSNRQEGWDAASKPSFPCSSSRGGRSLEFLFGFWFLCSRRPTPLPQRGKNLGIERSQILVTKWVERLELKQLGFVLPLLGGDMDLSRRLGWSEWSGSEATASACSLSLWGHLLLWLQPLRWVEFNSASFPEISW